MAAAVAAVQAGGVVVLPTDTVYGIGCDAFSAEAVQAVLAAKGRGREMPPPVLVPSPVSYTHLDVYKRQSLGRAPSGCRGHGWCDSRGVVSRHGHP